MEVFNNTKLCFNLTPMLFFQSLILQLEKQEKLTPFEMVGAIFALVISIVNKKLQQECQLEFNSSKGLIWNLQNLIHFPIDEAFEKMMIAWMDAGNTPSAAAFAFCYSLETPVPSALSAAIGAMSGLKHTSARIKVLQNLLNLRQVLLNNKVNCDNIDAIRDHSGILTQFLQKELDEGRLLYGFGHYFFKGPEPFIDPRIKLVQTAIESQKRSVDLLNILTVCKEICSSGVLNKRGSKEKIYLPINSDGYWSIYLYNNFCQLATINDFLDLIPLITALSRATGLIAHSTRQLKGSPIITKDEK